MPDSIISLLNERQKQQLISCRKEVVFHTGDVLFQQGDAANCMYRVEKGKVSLFRLMPNGDEKLFKVFMAGGLIAEMAVFMSPRKYPMSAKVEQDSTLSEFSHEDIASIVTNNPELSMKVMNYMSNRIFHLMNTIDILTHVNANQRLVMKLAEIYNAQSKKEGKIALPVTKKLLATQLGMTPETLSRAIKKLKDDGLIQESGNNLLILDIPLLCKSVNLAPDIF